MWNCLSIPWPEACPWRCPMRAAACLCLLCNSALSKLQSFISSVKSCFVRNHIELLKHLGFDNWLRSVRAFGFGNLWKTVPRWKPSPMRALCGKAGIGAPPLPMWDSQPQQSRLAGCGLSLQSLSIAALLYVRLLSMCKQDTQSCQIECICMYVCSLYCLEPLHHY